MEPFRREIFDLLQQKLKVGNRRGVHLNAIPNNSRYKFDLAKLSAIFKSLPERFVLDLLTLKNLKFTFSLHDTPSTAIDQRSYTTEMLTEEAPSKVKRKTTDLTKEENEREVLLEKLANSVDNLIFQSDAIIQEKGINSLGFGFPLLVRKDFTDGQITVAPILIWSVKMRPTSQMNTWEIFRSEDDPIYLNEVLVNHLQNDSGITLSPIPPEMLEDGKIDKPELFKICADLLEKLKLQQNIDFIENNYAEIHPIKSKASYEELLKEKGQGFIEKAGLFSLFEVQKQNIINDYQSLKEHFEKPEIILKEDFQSFTSIPTDPSQQEILEGLRTQSRILIQGPPGTGKSQTLTAILINALENKQKTLVVCEKQTALEVLYKALQRQGLDKYAILIKDSLTDRKLVVDAVRDTLDSNDFKRVITPYPEAVRKEQIDALNALKNNINAHHIQLFHPILGQENWMDISAQMLLYEPLKTSIELTALPLTFSEEEYLSLRNLLQKADKLYPPFAPYKAQFPYQATSLIKQSFPQASHQIEDIFDSYQKTWEEIKVLYKEYQVQYLSLRREEFAKQLTQFAQYIDETEMLTTLLPMQADEYHPEKTKGFFYRLTALFSSEKRKVLKNQKQLFYLCREVKKLSLHHNFSPIALTDDLFENKNKIISYRQEIEASKAQFQEKIEADFEMLDVLNFFDNNFTNTTLQKLISSVGTLKEQIKIDNCLADTSFGHTFEDFKNYMESVLEQHRLYEENKDHPLLLGYEWYAFFTPLSPLQKQCIQILEQAQAPHWEASFFYAYFQIFLLKKSGETVPFSAKSYEEMRKKSKLFASSQQDIIERYWDSARQVAVKQFEATHKDLSVANLYNKRKSEKHNRLTLRQIAHKDTDLLTTFFPIILTTPDTCCNLFQGKNFYFDYVVFDEASQLKLEDNLPAILKGKTVIIAGDEHQMPPSNYFSKIFDGNYEDEEDVEDEDDALVKNSLLSVESLLDYALEYNYDKHHLNFHYRSKHPYLIDFSNVAFYRGKLRPLPSLEETIPIEFYQVDGIFHEHTNEQEALQVIELLRNIPPKPDGSYPSVGVATFNITQRNFIRKKLLSLSNDPDEKTFSEKLSALNQAGLFIKNLENIQGDERDIIIISVTYGKKKDGKFVQSFGPLNHQKGYKLLNVIITRAKEKIYICNSIPQEVFLNYQEALAQEQSNNRRAVLYAYLAYTQSVSQKDEGKRQEVLQALSIYGNAQKESTSQGQLRFKEQVFVLLKEKYPNLNISQDKPFGGYTIDIFIEREKGGMPIAVECISKAIYQNDMGYLEDLHKEQILSQSGLTYMRIASDMPVKNYLNALEKLLQQ